MNDPQRILIVDDQASVLACVRFALESGTRTIAEAANGEAALAQIRTAKEPFDIIFTDHSMPRMNGLEFVRHLRADGFGGRIIVVSAHLSEEVRAGYEAARVDEIIDKPFNLDDLRAAVEQLVRAR